MLDIHTDSNTNIQELETNIQHYKSPITISHYITQPKYNQIKTSYHITNYRWVHDFINILEIKVGDEFIFRKINKNIFISCKCIVSTCELLILNVKVYIFKDPVSSTPDISSPLDTSNQTNRNFTATNNDTNDTNDANDIINKSYTHFEFKIVESRKIITILDNRNNLVQISGVDPNGMHICNGSIYDSDNNKVFHIIALTSLTTSPKIELNLSDILKLFIHY